MVNGFSQVQEDDYHNTITRLRCAVCIAFLQPQQSVL